MIRSSVQLVAGCVLALCGFAAVEPQAQAAVASPQTYTYTIEHPSFGKIGTFSDSLMAEANKQGWNVISMKKDWKRVFPFEAK